MTPIQNEQHFAAANQNVMLECLVRRLEQYANSATLPDLLLRRQTYISYIVDATLTVKRL
jgi:hypothetical protein